MSTKEVVLSFLIEGSPRYTCTSNPLDKELGISIMKKALEEVKRVIKENGGKFEVQENPRAIGAKN